MWLSNWVRDNNQLLKEATTNYWCDVNIIPHDSTDQLPQLQIIKKWIRIPSVINV